MTFMDVLSADTPMSIPDNDATGVESTVSVSGLLSSCPLNVSVDVNLTHTYVGDLVVGLTDPHGHRVVLWDRVGGSQDDLSLQGVDLTGELGLSGGNGTWRLDVSDHAWADVGTLDSWGLHLSCQ